MTFLLWLAAERVGTSLLHFFGSCSSLFFLCKDILLCLHRSLIFKPCHEPLFNLSCKAMCLWQANMPPLSLWGSQTVLQTCRWKKRHRKENNIDEKYTCSIHWQHFQLQGYHTTSILLDFLGNFQLPADGFPSHDTSHSSTIPLRSWIPVTLHPSPCTS